jgi:hypothetical protein
MTSRTPLIVAGSVVAAGVLWYLFRPELLFIDQTVNEAFPVAAVQPVSQSSPKAMPVQLASGMFHAGAHETKGAATIVRLGDGKRVLRLTNFQTSNGPDVRVLLISAADATDNDTVKNSKRVELASLKGNVGDQNYDIPADVDLTQYSAVTIWCNRFGVNFGTAPLQEAVSMHDAMPAGDLRTLGAGAFHSGAHETKGAATLYELPGGKRVLRLTDFETSNGPDVRVLLIAASDATDNDTVKASNPIELGKLKGNVGDQNYDVPANVDLQKYRAAVVWCHRFGVNFGTAPLR